MNKQCNKNYTTEAVTISYDIEKDSCLLTMYCGM